MTVASASCSEPASVVGTPHPRAVLRVEQVTYERSDGYDAVLETVDTPVVELSFDYAGQRIHACDVRDRFFEAAEGGMRVVLRDDAAENRARAVLEGFGAVELACLHDVAVPPGSRAHYLLRCDGDVHDYCGFTSYAVPQLRELGWVVELDASYPYRVVRADDSWYADIEPDEKPDWFSLELGLEIDGRRVNLLPALVGLLDGSRQGTTLSRLIERKRQIAVPLPDGRFVTVPPEQIRSILRVVSELYEGEHVEPLALKFSSLQASALPRLDEVFAKTGRGLRWSGGHGVRALGEELASPEPVEAPKTLRATLRSYQQTGVEWLQHLRSCGVGGILADDMGLGKTLQTIAHITVEQSAGRLTEPALVVSPTSLCRNWEREIQKFAPHLKTVVLQGPKRHGRYAEAKRADVVITSYPVLVRDLEKLAERDFHLLILDEAHTIKNTRSRAHQAAKRMKASHRLCLTGTPVENHLLDLWAAVRLPRTPASWARSS